MGTLVVPAETAALANAMAAHADETDDSHLGGRFHPGCGIVPAAFAVAEQQDRGGADLIRAVALGYDVGARLSMSLGYANPNNAAGHSTHRLGTAFGAAAAAAALLRFDPVRVRHVLSYACTGRPRACRWHRDYRVCGEGLRLRVWARNGVAGAMMVAAGFPQSGMPWRPQQFLHRLRRSQPQPMLTNELGTRFGIMQAPRSRNGALADQAVLDAIEALIAEHHARRRRAASSYHGGRPHAHRRQPLHARCLRAAYVRADAGRRRTQLCQYFHDHARMQDAAVLAVRRRIELIPSKELSAAVPARQAIVEIRYTDGRRLRHHAKAVHGSTPTIR